MNKDKAFEEMVSTIKEFDQCSIWLENEEQYTINPATNYSGGEEGYYMSSELGNIQYEDIESICSDMIRFIGDKKIVEVTVD